MEVNFPFTCTGKKNPWQYCGIVTVQLTAIQQSRSELAPQLMLSYPVKAQYRGKMGAVSFPRFLGKGYQNIVLSASEFFSVKGTLYSHPGHPDKVQVKRVPVFPAVLMKAWYHGMVNHQYCSAPVLYELGGNCRGVIYGHQPRCSLLENFYNFSNLHNMCWIPLLQRRCRWLIFSLLYYCIKPLCKNSLGCCFLMACLRGFRQGKKLCPFVR